MAQIKAPPAPFSVTERAARRIGEILAGEAEANLKLRISVSGGGCSGFQYGFALDHRDEDGDIAVEREGAKVVIDGMSLLYMLGCEVDFVEDLTGSYFRVTNPNATASCGCGNSFAV
ncbi:MAG TPA: iron-sulfur cluster insertion protein ErpA [Geminicoccaceae bacterium]|nr:iron-sulfur cluster insertion protein ErpA [Geminicoccaceae bacterium]